MKPISTLQYLSWRFLAKPANDRIAYRLIKKNRFRSLVEVGLGDGIRCERMIRVAQKYGESASVRYTGIDLFETREGDQPKLKLIEMHRRLNGLGAKAQLVPGTLGDSLKRIANSHSRTDLVLIQHDKESNAFEEAELKAAWKFLPRMLHASSQVAILYPNDEYEILNFVEIENRVRSLDSAVEKKAA